MGTLTRHQILAAFEAPIRPQPPSVLYRLGLALVTFAMILLPVAYLGLTGLVLYGVYWHITQNTHLLHQETRNTFRLILYVAPIVIGGIQVLFMIKPLFARRARPPSPVSVGPDREPLLFELVRGLCAVIGAPFPKRIDVDCQVNASASLRRGVLSLFGDDLVLTIGLPLAAGLYLRQLVGIISHELGHFAQGSAMRMSYIIRTINSWFARVVYERDVWDARLEAWSKQIDLRIGWMFWVARLMVWLTRRILWVLMLIGHTLSMFLSRQMEYDADQYEILVAGSEAFRSSALMLPALALAHQTALSHLTDSWQERRLADNLPELIVAELHRIPEDVRHKFVQERISGKGSLFDTHPPDGRRIEAALRANSPGIFRLEVPARVLFQDFEGLAKEATLAFYRQVISDEVCAQNLIPTVQVVRQQEALDADRVALERFFQGYYKPLEPPFLPDVATAGPPDVGACVKELNQIRTELQTELPRAREVAQSLKQAAERLEALSQAEALLECNLKFSLEEFGVQPSKKSVDSARQTALKEKERLLQDLEKADRLLCRRLCLAVQLAQVPDIGEHLRQKGFSQESTGMLLAALAGLRDAFPILRELMESMITAQALFNHVEGNELNKKLAEKIRAIADRWHALLVGLQERLAQITYPFEHAEGRISVARFAIERIPDLEDLPGLGQATDAALKRLFNLHDRIMGRLVVMAEAVEQCVDSPPVAPPKA